MGLKLKAELSCMFADVKALQMISWASLPSPQAAFRRCFGVVSHRAVTEQ